MKLYVIRNEEIRRKAVNAVLEAEVGECIKISKPTRTLEQNAKFHAICDQISKLKIQWAGQTRSAQAWKELLVSGHNAATGFGRDIEYIEGLEGEFVVLRESTAAMTVPRIGSLIEYAEAFLNMNKPIGK